MQLMVRKKEFTLRLVKWRFQLGPGSKDCAWPFCLNGFGEL